MRQPTLFPIQTRPTAGLANPPRRPVRALSEAGQVAYHDQAEAFHTANPHIFEMLKTLALEIRRRRAHFGIRTLWERMRWIREVETVDPTSDLKLNDHYHAFYARKLMIEVPELAGFFELRDSRR
jgi:hypothetical protein